MFSVLGGGLWCGVVWWWGDVKHVGTCKLLTGKASQPSLPPLTRRLSDESGKMSMSLAHEGQLPLPKSCLDSKDGMYGSDQCHLVPNSCGLLSSLLPPLCAAPLHIYVYTTGIFLLQYSLLTLERLSSCGLAMEPALTRRRMPCHTLM